MKLRAIRVAALRRFAAPVAVEDIADGINVLSAGNEAGKSTLFEALRAAFEVSHRATGSAVDRLKPYAGGNPRVEVDFEVDATHWRFSKQFGRGRFASLTNLSRDRELARDSEAEQAVRDLIGQPHDVPFGFGLFWVAQKDGLVPPTPDVDPETGKVRQRGEVATLRDAIHREIGAVAGGPIFEAVEARTAEALSKLVTVARSTVRAGGALDLAMKAEAAAAQALDVATNAARDAEKRIADISRLRSEIAALEAQANDPEAARERDRVAAALAAAEASRSALAAKRAAMNELALAFERSLKQVENLEAGKKDLADMRTRLERATVLDGEIRDLSAALNREPVTRAGVESLAALTSRHEVISATLKASVAKLDIRLRPAHAGRLRVDGVVIDHDATLDIATESTISAGDIAEIRVSMPKAQDAERLLREKGETASAIAALLDKLSVDGLEAARLRLDEREKMTARLDETRRHLAALAPSGIAALNADIETREASRAASDPDLIAREHAAISEKYRAAVAAVETLCGAAMREEQFAELSQRQAQLRSETEARDRRRTELRLKLAEVVGEQTGADNDGRAGQVQAASDALRVARDEVHRLRGEVAALQLLGDTLKEVKTHQRETFTTPIAQRLLPRLERLLGADAISVADNLAIRAVTRGGLQEDLAAVSDGTREQIGILTRLAMAELLAANGQMLPVVLDDPLAFADENRLGAVNAELVAASETSGLQIIVLTCRQGSFAGLPGHRLVISDWSAGAA